MATLFVDGSHVAPLSESTPKRGCNWVPFSGDFPRATNAARDFRT